MNTTSTERGRPTREETVLSASWRVNTASFEALELANLLKALRKVVGNLGTNAPEVEYAGFHPSPHAAVFLNPAEVMGEYPVPPAKTDRVIGEVVHDALLHIEWSGRVCRTLAEFASSLGMTDLVKFQRLVMTGEDIYVDSTLDGTVFCSYLRKARRAALKNAWADRALLKSGSSYDALILVWWASSFMEDGTVSAEARHARCLEILMGLTSDLAHLRGIPSGVTARCDARASLYRRTWERLAPLVRDLPLIDKRLSWWDQDASSVPGRQAGSGGNPDAMRLDPDLVRSVETELARTSVDLTPLVKSVVGWDNGDVVPISRWDYHIPAHPVVDRVLAGRIRAIFTSYSERRPRISRGLVSGRIDRRRLYRAGLTGRCFKEHEAWPVADWNITVLCDASGSMRGGRWKTVENTVSTLYHALSGYRGSLAAYAYFEIDGVCMISSLLENGRVLAVPPCGRTASGQAIIAAALFMRKTAQRRLIVHVTDGESNYGCPVSWGIDFCRREGIHLVTIGCGCRDREAMAEHYGSTIEFLDSFRQLPLAVERLLRRAFVYGTCPSSSRRPLPSEVSRKREGKYMEIDHEDK